MRPNKFVPILILLLMMGLGAIWFGSDQPNDSAKTDTLASSKEKEPLTLGNEELPNEAIAVLNIELDKQRRRTEELEETLQTTQAVDEVEGASRRADNRKIDELTLVIAQLEEQLQRNPPKKLSQELAKLQREVTRTNIVQTESDRRDLQKDYSGEIPRNASNEVDLVNGRIVVTPIAGDHSAPGQLPAPLQVNLDEDAVTPILTIPLSGTGLSGVAATALIGKIPRNGRIEHPFRFKVLLGDTVLAANGQHVNGLARTVVTGIVEGDSTLNCVRARATQLLFVFDDGRFVTASGSDNEPLAFLTDEYGDCITGERVSNQSKAAAWNVVAESLRLAGEAYAESQTTSREFSDGTVDTIVTGEDEDYLIGRIGEGAGNAAASLINERAAELIDVVHVPAGTPVTIHFLQNIEIDRAEDQRRLRYAATETSHRRLP